MFAYVASPFFSDEQRSQVDRIVAALDAAGIASFSPMRDAGVLRSDATRDERLRVVATNRAAIRASNLVVCNATGRDLGTIWEAGYADASRVPVVYVAEGLDGPFNVMLAVTGVASFRSFDDLAAYLSEVGRTGTVRRVDFEGPIE